MKGALVTFIAKVEGVAKEKFLGLSPRPRLLLPPPPIKIPGGATVRQHSQLFLVYIYSCDSCVKFSNINSGAVAGGPRGRGNGPL